MRPDINALASELTSLSSERLDTIGNFWGVGPILSKTAGKTGSNRTVTGIQKFLINTANPWAAMHVLEKLTPAQQRVIAFAVDYEEDSFQAGILQEVITPEKDIRAVIEPLLYQLILWMSWGGWIAARSTPWTERHRFYESQYLTIPAFMIWPFASALQVFGTPEAELIKLPLAELTDQVPLLPLAVQLGIHESIIRAYPAHLGRLVAANLQFPASVERLLQEVSPRARRIFEELVKTSEPVLLEELTGGSPSSSRKPAPPDNQPIQDLLPFLGELYDRCLLLPARRGGKPACWVHPQIAAAHGGQAPSMPAAVARLEPAPTPPNTILASGMSFWWDLMVVGLWIESGEANVTSTSRQVPKKAASQLLKSMSPLFRTPDHPEQETIGNLFNFLVLADVARLDNLKMLPRGVWVAWKQEGLLYQVGTLLAGWMNRVLSEAALINTFPGIVDALAPTLEVRRQSWRWLEGLAPGAWYETAAFLQHIRYKDPYFLRPEKQIRKSMGEAGVFDLHQSWFQQEGLAIAIVLNQIPRLAGILDMGYGSEHAPEILPPFFRLTEFGREALQSVSLKPREDSRIILETGHKPDGTGQPLLVQPNMEILMMEFDPRIGYDIGRFARPTRFDQIGVFTLTAESVKSAAGRGIDYKHMLDSLTRYSRKPLPQNVEYQIKDWACSIRQVRFQRGTVVEVDSAEDLDRLLASKPMRTRLLRRLSPTAALVSVGEDIKSLSKALDPSGFHWNAPDDWEDQEEAAYNGITRTLKRFNRYRV